jgi:hypothetical protein
MSFGQLTVGGSVVVGAIVSVPGEVAFSLDDDTAATLELPYAGTAGIFAICTGATPGAVNPNGVFQARCSTSPVINAVAMLTSANVVLQTGALTGTTGTDGNTTISAHTDRKLYIENRTGVARSYYLSVLVIAAN